MKKKLKKLIRWQWKFTIKETREPEQSTMMMWICSMDAYYANPSPRLTRVALHLTEQVYAVQLIGSMQGQLR
ncbi:hypothetical protein ES707_22920 [subsurface metagenome]